MEIDFYKGPRLKERDFVRLYLAMRVNNKDYRGFTRFDVQRKLYDLYKKDASLEIMFDDICVKEDGYLDLNKGFNYAYLSGLIYKVLKGGKTILFINGDVNDEYAKKIISEFDTNIVLAM